VERAYLGLATELLIVADEVWMSCKRLVDIQPNPAVNGLGFRY